MSFDETEEDEDGLEGEREATFSPEMLSLLPSLLVLFWVRF